MKRSMGCRWTIRAFAFASITLLTGTSVWATTHVVKFGGSAGFKYVPDEFTAAVGDTVAWEGDFTVHPLSSTTIPAGSSAWHVATGTRFIYVISMQGAFNYKCDIHSGMTGSFQAATTGIGNAAQRRDEAAEAMTPTIISPVSGKPFIRFTAPGAGVIAVRIIDLNGRQIASSVPRTVQQGTHHFPLMGMNATGIFRIHIIFNGKETSRMFTNVH